jgi:octanoyl-[GcvH]:protein N-octanoyltransferase
VAAGELPETLRLARPGRIVAFGKQDVVSPAYGAAVRTARDGGFEAIQRLAGGRAAVFHERTIAFAHAIPDPDPKPGIQARFDLVAGIMAAAFGRLGVDARVGEVAGEYCPGGHSVNARGRRKLMGVGQRLIAGGAHVGGVVVVDRSDLVNEILAPVYAALDLTFDPAATGSVAEEAGGASLDDVQAAILAEYAGRYELEPADLDEETIALARRLAPDHIPPA